MGRGPRTEPEKRIAAPIDLLEKDGGEVGGSASDGSTFCAREHTIQFFLAEEASAQAGDRVFLVQAHPPAVRTADGFIGEISEADASAMANCIRMGYRMIGTIESIDLNAGSGVLKISGKAGKLT